MGITLNQARDGVGRRVIYRSLAMRQGRDRKEPEVGTIKRVGETMVFVDYTGQGPMATRPEDLDFENGILDADEHRDRMIDAREAMRTIGAMR